MNDTMTLTSSSIAQQGLTVVANLWQNYGGIYGDYYATINAVIVTVLWTLRARNCLPWLQDPLSNCFLSSVKLEIDAVALWGTGKLQTHHQYTVLLFLIASSYQRFGGSWTTSADVQTLWYGAFVRILSRVCVYTLLSAMFLQYNEISWYYALSTLVIVILSRTHEVFYPWLASIDSPRKMSEQSKRAMSEFDAEVSRIVLTSEKTPWPSDFRIVDYTRMVEFKQRLKCSGIFVSLFSLDMSTSIPHNRCRLVGLINGSGFLAAATMFSTACGLFRVATAKDSTLFWKVTTGSFLHFQSLMLVSFLNLPALVITLNALVRIITDGNKEYTLLWWTELQAYYLELKRFLDLLVISGFPFGYQTTVLASQASVLFWRFVDHLEGLELAIYVCFSGLITISGQFIFYCPALLAKYAGLGDHVSFICSKMSSTLIWLFSLLPLFPGLRSIGIEILNAEMALAAQRTCSSGQCIKTLRLDEVLAHLEEIVAAKGEIHGPCTFFTVHHPAEERVEALEEEFKRRAIALGLMNSARNAVDNLRRAKVKEGASALKALLRLLSVYTMDSAVPDAKTQESILAIAKLVQGLMTEFRAMHWASYKDRGRLESPNLCECVTERDWLIMVAQLNVSMLLVYAGWRSSSLYWPYVQFESLALREWVSGRSNSLVGASECAFLSI